MANADSETRKLLNAYLDASRAHNTTLRAWADAPHADKKKFMDAVEVAKARLDSAYVALWRQKL